MIDDKLVTKAYPRKKCQQLVLVISKLCFQAMGVFTLASCLYVQNVGQPGQKLEASHSNKKHILILKVEMQIRYHIQ